MSETSHTPPGTVQPVAPGEAKPDTTQPRSNKVLAEILNSSIVISILAVVLAMVVGAILIALTDPKVHTAAGYFFARPGDTIAAVWQSATGAYGALFQGSIYNFKRPDFLNGIRPLTETLTFATPLILAGLGVGLAFRVGMFNIGGRGQMLIAAACAGWVGFTLDLPPVVHLLVAIAAGIIGGAFWGGIVGVLKARTGAHEVIITIMLNYVAFYLITFMLSTQGLLQAPGSNVPKSAAMAPNSVLPKLLGDRYNLHAGFLIAILAVVFVWWLFSRSSIGFRFRAVGENPNAARVAGIDVKNTYVYAMLLSGGLIGLAGVSQVLGTVTSGFDNGIDAGIGFDAITVALLGRSRPGGILIAGILFGALKAGGYSMQATQGVNVPIDIVLVLQALIVLFIAAPPLVRAIFFLPKPDGSTRRTRRSAKKEVSA
ncbi:nucleoside ABC transporter membrane protein [Plantibacter flavus]|uniref:Nucleoside ABC transporter membrane protein n=2 Tax=Plantibacter TaxID=190323 RepID=A0A3N2C4Q6_9MICO|nr:MULTISPECIES: ABC transporter permease [Plantibacter]ROR82492.1 nucleoside ABC transporter membrane protein [Plantibacter flavus]SMG37203.1 nucleoside ABC transporter membrane protein [Plantibacter flavus]SMQ70817.1 nucleoside ABC transporter membrane protein [Plantibacter sp. VKM Ac-1784]